MKPAGPVDLRLAVPAAGTWAAAALACGWRATSGVAVAVVALAVLAIAVWRGRLGVAGAAGGVLLGAASAALHVSSLHSGPVAELAAGRHARADLAMTLVRDPVSRVGATGRPYVLVDATVTAVGGRGARAPVLVIAHGGEWLDLLPGQRVRVSARVVAPRSGDDVAAVVLPTRPPIRLGRPPWWQRAAGYVRSRLRQACARLPPDERGLVPGLVMGDVSRMPPSLTDAFRTSGLTHLNAVSGENCAIVLATVGAMLRRTPLSRGLRIVVAGVSLAAFVVLARPSPSVLRAATMGAVALLAMSVGRRTQPLPLLSGAVLALVLTNPFLARSAGFALSVLATAAIVVLAPRWTVTLSRQMPRPLALAIAVPAAAQLACTPILVLVFGQATPWAVPANLLAAPAVAPATIVGVVAAVVAVASIGAASVVVWVAALPAGWLAAVARSMAALPGAGAGWPAGWRGLAALAATATMATVVVAVRRRPSFVRAMLGAWPP
jgi:competence protein ComEC